MATTSILEDKTPLLEDESQDSILHLRARLYRYDAQRKKWDERGEGFMDLLKHKESGKVRLLIRHSLSLHLLADHPITPTMNLEEYAGELNSCMWRATDYQDGELKNQLFRVEFASPEDWEAFIKRFEDITETQCKKEENESSDATLGFLNKITAREPQTN